MDPVTNSIPSLSGFSNPYQAAQSRQQGPTNDHQPKAFEVSQNPNEPGTDKYSDKTKKGYNPGEKLGKQAAAKELNLQEQLELRQLQARDREVRAHEQAHIAAGGQYIVSGANFQYKLGPDGQRYAVGGEVSIDTSKVRGDPEATIQKAQNVRRAALAPARPSGQDRMVASRATSMEMQARQDLIEQREKETAEQRVSIQGLSKDRENPLPKEQGPTNLSRQKASQAYTAQENSLAKEAEQTYKIRI